MPGLSHCLSYCYLHVIALSVTAAVGWFAGPSSHSLPNNFSTLAIFWPVCDSDIAHCWRTKLSISHRCLMMWAVMVMQLRVAREVQLSVVIAALSALWKASSTLSSYPHTWQEIKIFWRVYRRGCLLQMGFLNPLSPTTENGLMSLAIKMLMLCVISFTRGLGARSGAANDSLKVVWPFANWTGGDCSLFLWCCCRWC